MPVKAKALRLTFPVFTSAGALVTTGTMATTISKDGGTFANPSVGVTNATQVATSSGVWYVDLSATDLTCDTLAVKVSDGTNPPTILVVYPIEIKELTGTVGFSDGANGIEELLAWLLALSKNVQTTTATTATLKRADGTTNQATSTISDNGTTFTRNAWA